MQILFGSRRQRGPGVPREKQLTNVAALHTHAGAVCRCVSAGNLCHLELLQSRQILPGGRG